MAYNPFNIFRRNQKALFAVLTVFIMIMFTLQSGVAGGDFFENVSRWLGGTRGEALCKIDGHTVTSRELTGGPRSVDFRRKMANRFMALAATETVQKLTQSLREQSTRLSGPAKQTADDALQYAEAWMMGALSPQQAFAIPIHANALLARSESPAAKTEEKEVARAGYGLMMLVHKLAAGGNTHYFLNAPNRNDRDLIEFLLWEKKADQFGINFTRADVARLIQSEFFNFFKSDVDVRRALQQQMQGFTIEACMDAIAEEFKVRAAQAAVLGQASRYHAAPAYPTPWETFEYYREQCSPAVYEAIAVPVAGFVDKVQGQPTDAEVRELFDKYQNDEPNPKNEAPGFKEPRKIAVEWIGVTGEEPYYKKLAEEQVKVGEVMARAGGALTVPLPGALDAWAATAAGALSLKDPAVAAAYNTQVNQFKFQLRNEYSSSTLLARDLLPSSVVRPGVLAATAGGVVGQLAGAGSPLSAVSLAMAAPIAYEVRDRVKVGMPLVLGALPGPAMVPALVGGTAASAASEPKPLPADYLRPEMLKTTVDARAKVIAFGGRPDFNNPDPGAATEKGDIPRFIEELGKMAAEKKDKAAIDKYVHDFLAARGIALHGKSAEPRDEWHLEDDPGLQPLVQAQKESLRRAGGAHGGEFIPFGQSFFWTTDFDRNTFRMRRVPSAGNFQATMYPAGDPTSRDDGKPHYVVWRTEDLAPKKVSLAVARPAVVAAWKRIKARDLAKARADALAEQVRGAQVADPFLLNQFLADTAAQLRAGIADPKASQRARAFTIPNVAPLVPDMTFDQQTRQLRQFLKPFELRESENIPYPTPEMRKELLENRDKPAKTVFVMADAPKDTFYVTTLMRRDLKDRRDFIDNVFATRGGAQEIRLMYQEEAMKGSRDSVLALLKKEFNYQETEEQKKKLDENAKSATTRE